MCRLATKAAVHGVRYGSEHRRERARWLPAVQAGAVMCSRCDLPIGPGEVWDLDHDERGGYLGPAHADCNRGASQLKRHVIDDFQPRASRDW
jgi:hypothetical protein